ncbi:MAG: hypothetical protein ISS17_00525 [Bacteroidales bacterium]|nr:hypothetical protein [Bacteroidales bacterium]
MMKQRDGQPLLDLVKRSDDRMKYIADHFPAAIRETTIPTVNDSRPQPD